MDSFILTFLNSMLSQAGILATLLLGGLVYQTIQLGKCRVRNEQLHEQILKLSLDQIGTIRELTKYLKLNRKEVAK